MEHNMTRITLAGHAPASVPFPGFPKHITERARILYARYRKENLERVAIALTAKKLVDTEHLTFGAACVAVQDAAYRYYIEHARLNFSHRTPRRHHVQQSVVNLGQLRLFNLNDD